MTLPHKGFGEMRGLDGVDLLIYGILNRAVRDALCRNYWVALRACRWFMSSQYEDYFGYIINVNGMDIWDRLDAIGPRNERIADLIRLRKENRMDEDVIVLNYAMLDDVELEQVFDLLPDDVVSVTIV